jgi:pimeloyl-ACP methyl ester carboxylesterase
MVNRQVDVPVLHLHGALDGCIAPSTARASARWAGNEFAWKLYADLGHFPHEEDPQRVTADLVDWLGKPE